MKWLGIIIVLLLLLSGVYWYLQQKHPSSPANQPLQLSQDLYPLYGDTQWSAPVAETVMIGTSTIAGASITMEAAADTMNPGSFFTPFDEYYAQKLAALGWQVDNYLAAGGHTGGQTGYRKGSEVILTRFSIDYHNVPQNAPSECPCDVTFSLFSSPIQEK